MEPEYQQQVGAAFTYHDSSTWCDLFNDWGLMQLSEDFSIGNNVHVISMGSWTKLKATFGGGPEIPFFSYQEEVEVQTEDAIVTKKVSKHDFQPIRIRVNIIKRNKEINEKPLTLLVSKHLTHNQFKNYLTQIRTDVSSRVEMFVINGQGQSAIYEVPKERKTLAEMGCADLSDVVIFDVDVAFDTVSNRSELYHIIGRQFNIQKHEYES